MQLIEFIYKLPYFHAYTARGIQDFANHGGGTRGISVCALYKCFKTKCGLDIGIKRDSEMTNGTASLPDIVTR